MKERPILFSSEMVKAILEGRKTQTRRVAKKIPSHWTIPPARVKDGVIARYGGGIDAHGQADEFVRCPYGKAGDRLWVRETWEIKDCGKRVSIKPEAWPDGWPIDRLRYKADQPLANFSTRSPIHMPRWASRITLEIERVWAEHVQDINDVSATAEGSPKFPAVAWFAHLWETINYSRGYGWDENPWVWVVEFRRIEP